MAEPAASPRDSLLFGAGHRPYAPYVGECGHVARRARVRDETVATETLIDCGVPPATLALWGQVWSGSPRTTGPSTALLDVFVRGMWGPIRSRAFSFSEVMTTADAAAWCIVLCQTGAPEDPAARAWRAVSDHGWVCHAAGLTVPEVVAGSGWTAGQVATLAALRGVAVPPVTQSALDAVIAAAVAA